MVVIGAHAAADIVRELTYTGRIFSGDDAVRYGLATRAVDDPLADARALAREIAGQNPHAIRAAKRLLVGASRRSAAEVLQAESDEQQRLMGSSNQLEAVRSRLEKRAPKFRPARR